MPKHKWTGPPSACKEYIQALVNYCQAVVWAGEYKIDIYWHKTCAEDNAVADGDTTASIEVGDVYLQAVVNIYPPLIERWREKNYKRVGQIILHELCHLLTHPLKSLYEDNQRPSERVSNQCVLERQTTRIQNALMDALPDDWYLPTLVIPKMKRVIERL